MTGDSPAFGQADLTNCERELIHLAGSVQPHELESLLDQNLETHHEEVDQGPSILAVTAESMPGLGIVAAMLLAMFMSVWGSWHATRYYLIPPLNEITAACDFSDELGSLILGRHRAFMLRNEAFA